jgi:hypothetical protein
MRLPLSNGLYIDPCNPTLLHDSPNEPQGETVELKEHKELNKNVEELKSIVDELTRKDFHFD